MKQSFLFLARSLRLGLNWTEREKFDCCLARPTETQPKIEISQPAEEDQDTTDTQLISNFSVVEVNWTVHANSQSDILDAAGRPLVRLLPVSHPNAARLPQR